MRRWIALFTVVASLAIGTTALAQEPPAPPPPDAGATDPGDSNDSAGSNDSAKRVRAEATDDDLMPFGHPCEVKKGVRFCPTASDGDRVPSFDKVPLDVDVTLPEKGKGPFPTIVMMHGYGGDKTDFETQDSTGSEGDGNITYHYNNVYYAKQGYAVVTPSVRGFGRSCGAEDSRDDPNCDDGYIHLADQRFEVRDTQHLLGLLEAGDKNVKGDNQEITKAKKIGVTGISYGGGQSIMLALLRDRIADCSRTHAKPGRSNCNARSNGGLNRDLKKWKSPDGDPMKIAAAFPRWPWTSLDASLLPNGRFRDFERANHHESRNPIGIPIESFLAGLNAVGELNGYYCGNSPPGPEPCDDSPNSDLTKDNARIQLGEPYSNPPDPFIVQISNEIYHHHGGEGLFDEADDPAPLLVENGFTDDLFPPREALRLYNELRKLDSKGRAGDKGADISLLFGDLGHSRGANKQNTDRDYNDRGSDFFESRIRGKGHGPDKGSATVYTQTCPMEAPADGPFEAGSWPAIHDPDGVSFGDPDGQLVTSEGGNQATGDAYDPIAGSGDAPCTKTEENDEPGTANYTGKPSKGYTMVGLPTVRAKIDTTDTPDGSPGGQLDSRLFDVAPDGQQTLISRGAYRLEDNQDGKVTFQLQGNAWCFEEGHRPKLQLLGNDDPYLRATTGPDAGFEVSVRRLTIDLPTLKKGDPCRPSGGSGGSSGGGSGGGGGNHHGNGSGNDDGNDASNVAGYAPALAAGLFMNTQCTFFSQNFVGVANLAGFSHCVMAGVDTLTLGSPPSTSCRVQGLSGKRKRGERRSDLAACVLAATFARDRALRLGLSYALGS